MKKKPLWILFLVAMVVFFTWRFTRNLNIFVVEEKFAKAIPVAIPEGLSDISAKSCGGCHQEIYREWAQSIHAQAWTDPYYQVDMAFEGSPRICITCHIPLETQQQSRVLGYRDRAKLDPILTPNPDFDPALQQEGVTCAVCHLRKGTLIGPYATEAAPHPVKVDPAFLSGMSPCDRCHVVSGERWDMFFRMPPCGTVTEIRNGGQEPDCVGCHMPPVTRPMALGAEPRAGGRHLFHGGHTPAMVKSALTVQHNRKLVTGRAVHTVTLINTGADHYLPTGTPDRHLTLEFRLRDAHGRVTQQADHKLIRQVMWRPFIIDLWDTRLRPREPRPFTFAYDPQATPEPAVLEVTVRYHLLEESRRRRINYINTDPIAYPIYQRRFDLRQKP